MAQSIFKVLYLPGKPCWIWPVNSLLQCLYRLLLARIIPQAGVEIFLNQSHSPLLPNLTHWSPSWTRLNHTPPVHDILRKSNPISPSYLDSKFIPFERPLEEQDLINGETLEGCPKNRNSTIPYIWGRNVSVLFRDGENRSPERLTGAKQNQTWGGLGC